MSTEGTNKRLLLIDDNPAIHEDYRKILSVRGNGTGSAMAAAESVLFDEPTEDICAPTYDVESAFQGEEGLHKVEESLMQNRPYAVAFVDMRMPPGWDGLKTIQHLWDVDPRLEIVICTAYSDHSWEDITRTLKPSSQLLILKKPFDNVEVLQIASALTEKWRLARLAQMKVEELETHVRNRTKELAVANEQLRGARDAAEAASRAKSDFLANVSHELRTPMNAIVGFTGVLELAELTADQRDCITTIKSSSEALLSIIDDLLECASLEAQKSQLSSASFPLRAAVTQGMTTYASRAEEKGLTLTFDFADDLPDELMGDLRCLNQLLRHLIGNAIKFTEAGRVEIHFQRDPTPDPSDVLLHVLVRDTGIGIPPEKQQLIFQPFTQGDGSSTRIYGGTGLGLTISSRLVSILGGKLWLESEPGHGTTFHFTFPSKIESAVKKSRAA